MIKGRHTYRINEEVIAIKITENENNTIESLYNEYVSKRTPRSTDLLKREFGIKFNDIIGYGTTESIGYGTLKKLIPVSKTKGLPRPIEGHFKCYAVPEEQQTIVLHENRESSWQCFLNSIGNPDYLLLINEVEYNKGDTDER